MNRQELSPISEHINALNRAYAHLDNAIDRCTNEQEYSALLDKLEAQGGEPYMDILYQHAWEIIQQRIKGESK
jgi:hypothetical protein